MTDKKSVFTNFIWRFMERCGAQGVSFIVSIILARLLEPSIYGTIALVTVFTALLDVFIDSGFGSALIQKKDADDLDFSTVFYFNVVVCIVLYTLLFLAAPYIAAFYKDTSLTPIIRVLGLTLIISGVKNIQHAYVSRNMQFKRFFFATLGGTIGAACIGIAMAYHGFGVWALVAQHLFNTAMDTIILWITVKWRPRKMFSLQRLKEMFSFGWKLLISHFLNKLYSNIRQLIIGKMYTTEDLAFYNKGDKFPKLIVNNIEESIRTILFPVMSKKQDEPAAIKNMTRRAMKVSTYIMAPMMIGMSAVAEPLIRLMLTEKWMVSVPYMRIFCITYIFYPLHNANLSAIKAMGRSDLLLKLEVIKKTVGIFVLLLTMRHGVMVMAYSLLVTSVLSQIINSWPNKKLLNYSYPEQLKDIMPGILMAVVMGACVYPVQWLGLSDMLTLLIQVPLGAVIFVVGSILFKLDSFLYLWDIIKNIISKKMKH